MAELLNPFFHRQREGIKENIIYSHIYSSDKDIRRTFKSSADF